MPSITVEQRTIELLVTKDYDQFKLMQGNRLLDQNHVNRLRKKIENEGNLTSEFPVNVNENMEVIDGQHRIMALKELNYPVYYTISEGAGLATVRQVNVGRRNWTWKDYAQSFAAEGNVQYKDLLDFVASFPFSFSIVNRFTNGGKRTEVKAYQSGDYRILDKGLAFRLLNQLTDLNTAIPFPMAAGLSAALYDTMTHPEYDHKRMLKKLTQYGSQLHQWRTKKDWQRNLEDVYNIGQTEATSVRFF